MRTPGDWNLVILPWALENWLAINSLTVTKPESVCVQLLGVCLLACLLACLLSVCVRDRADS
jgi:hypothetical protein